MTQGRKLRAVVLVAIVTLQVLAVVPASSLAKTTAGGNASVSAAGDAPGVAMPDATINDSTDSDVTVAYNATGMSSPNLYVSGPKFSKFYGSSALSQKGTKTFTIPADTYGGGNQSFTVSLIDGSGKQVASDDGFVNVTSPVSIDGYTLSSSSVPMGVNVTANVTLSNPDGNAQNYTLTLYDVFPDGAKFINKSRKVEVGAGKTRYVTFNRSWANSGDKKITINQQPVKTVTVTNPVNFVNTTVSKEPVGVNEDVQVNVTLHNPTGSAANYRMTLIKFDRVDGEFVFNSTMKNPSVPANSYETVSYTTNFSSAGEKFTFLYHGTQTLAEPKVFVAEDTTGSPSISTSEAKAPSRAVVNRPALFVANLTNTGDAAGVYNLTLTTNGTTTYEKFLVEPNTSRNGYLTTSYGKKKQYAATFGGQDFTVNVSDPIVVDTSIDYVNGTEPSSNPNVNAGLSGFGIINVRITNPDQPGSMDLSSLGVADDTTFRINVSVRNYEPRVLVSSGTNLGWSRVNVSGKSLTNVTAYANPAQIDFKGTNANVDNWDSKVNESKPADVTFQNAIMMGISDGTHPFFDSRPSSLSGMTVSTDAQLFRPPAYEPPAPGKEPQLKIKLAAPHLTSNGNVNQGYYRAFLPDSLLDEWNVTSTSELDVNYTGDPSASFEVTNESGGMMVNLTHHYSSGTAVISADTVAPTASAGSDTTIDEGDSVSFDASGSSDNDAITKYEWDFDGDGSTDATGATPSHTYSSAGTYTVTVTVTDASGNVATDTATVTVEETSSSSTSSTSTSSSSTSSSGGPDISVADATLGDSEIEPGDAVLIEATLENDGAGDGTYTAELVVSGTVVEQVDVNVPGNERRTVSFVRTFDEAGSFDVAVSNLSAGTLTVEQASTETPASTETATPEPTATETPEPTETATPEPTATDTPEPTTAEAQDSTPEPTTAAPTTSADATTVVEAAGDGTMAADSPTAAATPTESQGQPGFGIVVALVALLAAGLLARRR